MTEPWDGDPLADNEPTPTPTDAGVVADGVLHIPVAPGQTPAFEATLETVDDPRLDDIITTVNSILRGVIVINTKVEELKVLVARLPVNAPTPLPQPFAAPTQPAPPVNWQLNQPPAAGAPPAPPAPAAPTDPTTLPGYGWTCPVHPGQWKVVPAGIAKQGPRIGQAYPAFIACTVHGCREKPPRS